MKNSWAKKTPRGKRGIRVIVVVANSVLTTAARLCWIFVIVLNPLLLLLIIFFLLICVFWLRCLFRCRWPPPARTFFVRLKLVASLMPIALNPSKNMHLKNSHGIVWRRHGCVCNEFRHLPKADFCDET